MKGSHRRAQMPARIAFDWRASRAGNPARTSLVAASERPFIIPTHPRISLPFFSFALCGSKRSSNRPECCRGETMSNDRPTRRNLLALLGAGAVAAAVPPARADEASPVTPDLVEAAKREGQVMFLSAADVLLMQKIVAAFQAKYPGIKVDAQRTGSERIFQRLDQEYGSEIHVVDVVESSDAAHFL